MQYKLLLLIFATSVFGSCQQRKQESENISLVTEFPKFEVYCFCILDIRGEQANVTMNNCSTTVAIHLEDIIKPKYLLTSTTDSTKIEALQNIFFKSQSSKVEMRRIQEPRLAFLFKRDSTSADTMVFHSDSQFILNSKWEYSYPFHVIDTLKHILGLKNISCSAN